MRYGVKRQTYDGILSRSPLIIDTQKPVPPAVVEYDGATAVVRHAYNQRVGLRRYGYKWFVMSKTWCKDIPESEFRDHYYSVLEPIGIRLAPTAIRYAPMYVGDGPDIPFDLEGTER